MGASRPVQERGCLALTLNAAINSSGSLTGARNQPLTCWRAATLQERRVVGLRQRVIRRKGDEHADAALPRGLLRRCRERPRCGRAAEQRDELAAFHSITSSARASSAGGTSRPSALAVLRLMTSSNLVGCITGRSAGLSPLRMRPTYTPSWRYESNRLSP